MNYINKNLKMRKFKQQYKPLFITPYCIPHIQYLKKNKIIKFALKLNEDDVFNKWYKRPDSCCALYWKFHKNEYPF